LERGKAKRVRPEEKGKKDCDKKTLPQRGETVNLRKSGPNEKTLTGAQSSRVTQRRGYPASPENQQASGGRGRTWKEKTARSLQKASEGGAEVGGEFLCKIGMNERKGM